MRRFNEQTARMKPGSRISKPTISMSPRGAFRLNGALLGILGAKVGDKVEVIEDEGEWYIAKSKVGILVNKLKDARCGQMHSRILQQALSEATAKDRGSILVAAHPVEVQGVKCYALLLGSMK